MLEIKQEQNKTKHTSNSTPFPHFSALWVYKLTRPDSLHKTQTNVSIKPTKDSALWNRKKYLPTC